jgi:hypothetical protein
VPAEREVEPVAIGRARRVGGRELDPSCVDELRDRGSELADRLAHHRPLGAVDGLDRFVHLREHRLPAEELAFDVFELLERIGGREGGAGDRALGVEPRGQIRGRGHDRAAAS